MTTSEIRPLTPNALIYCALAAFTMAYGWGYRGTVGHEAGAMVPGALLGLVLCLGSERLDWHRRTAVAGLFAAAGWAWGGSLSYMEQTFYVVSDSFWDVLYGYTMLFFLGGLWASLGGGALGLALTEPRSELERLVRPFTVICVSYFVVYIYLFFQPAHKEALETLTVRHFHDGDWLPATLALGVSAAYWVLRPADRSATALFFLGSLAWWIGYGGLTFIGGLRLGPLHRSESWGGVLGILVAFIVYLMRRQNRAALMLCLYGLLGGGLAFSVAVFLRHPMIVNWGPFQGRWPQWRFAEDSFGFLMAMAIALGVLRLIRGGLVPPKEDVPRARLDVYAVFVVLVALVWINFRRHAEPWLQRSNASNAEPFLGLDAWVWYVFGGASVTAPVLYCLKRYLDGDRQMVPSSAFGKGAAIALILLWVTVGGQLYDEPAQAAEIAGHLLLWVPAAIASMLLVTRAARAQHAGVPASAQAASSDAKWRVGAGYYGTWAMAPIVMLAITAGSMAMQDEAREGLGRKRFGEDAYWRQTARLMGTWKAVGVAESLSSSSVPASDLPIDTLVFDEYRNVIATSPSGETSDVHRWFLKNQYTWLDWYGKVEGHAERAETPLQFRGQQLYIAWPPNKPEKGFVVFERMEN